MRGNKTIGFVAGVSVIVAGFSDNFTYDGCTLV